MHFGFHIISEQQFAAYRELRLVDPPAAEDLRWEEWEVPKTRRNDWSCSLAQCIAEDHAGYRGSLPQATRDLLDDFLKRTVFLCWNSGVQTADLPIQGFEFCSAISPARAAHLAANYRAIDIEQVQRCYRSERGIDFELFAHVLETWSQLMESVGSSERYLLVVAG